MSVEVHSRTIWSGNEVSLGEFRCRPSEPDFVRKSVAAADLLVLGRTACLLQVEADEPFVASPDQAVFYRAGSEYTCRILEPAPEVTWYLQISPTVTDAARAKSVTNRRGMTVTPEQALGFRAVVSAGRAGVTLQMEEWLVEFIDHLLTGGLHATPSRETAGRDRPARWVAELLAETYRESLTLSEIGRRIGYSPFYLARAFRIATGSSIHARRETLRMRAALHMLGEMPLGQLALTLGYSSQSHFTSAFRRHYGCTPRAAAPAFSPTARI